MKQLIAPIAIIVALIAFFVIIDRKEFSRHDDVQTVQSESPTSNTKTSVSVLGTKPVNEVRHAAEQKQEASVLPDPPTAIPVLSPEEALIANAEALAASAKKPASVRQQEDLHDLDFSKDVIDVLLYFIPVSILLYFLFLTKAFKKMRIRSKTTSWNIKYSYSPLVLLLIVVFAQWINAFCNKNENDYDSIFYEKKTITNNNEWSKVNDKLSRVQISYGMIASPALFIDDIALQELPLSDLKKMTQKSELQFPYFSRSGGYIVVPNTYVDKNIDVYLERQVFNTVKKVFSIRGCLRIWFLIFVFWLGVQLYINKGLSVVAKKAFRQKCLLVCLISFSVILAGAFWMSHIPFMMSNDGIGYISLACSDTIMRCLYGSRTPGYPLFLSVISFFSPTSFNSIIYFQTLIYLLSLTWVLYELYKKGVPMILVLVAYYLFYDYLSHFFFYVLCETLEISSIAATAAIGLSLSNAVIKKHTAKFVILLVLTIAMVFYTMMIKPFPGLILIPGCLMFLALLGTVKFRKAFVLTIIVGILSVLLPATYCTIRWKTCGDFNFCSLINTMRGAYQLITSTPQSIASERIHPEQRELAYEAIKRFEENRPDLKLEHPWLNTESTYNKMVSYMFQFLWHDGLYSFFDQKWKDLDEDQKERFKTSVVYANDQSKAFLKMGDPELKKIMMGFYWDEVYKLYSSENPLWISETLREYNPFQSSSYFHKRVTFPLTICLLIAFLPWCKRIRYGSFKTIIVIVGFAAIPILTYFAQILFLDYPVFEARSEMVMFFSAMLGTFVLSLYCIYSCIVSLLLLIRVFYLMFAPHLDKCLLNWRVILSSIMRRTLDRKDRA